MIVSDDFITAFKLFNLNDVSCIIDRLSETERYLLLLKCLDEHDVTESIVSLNYKNYISEMSDIYQYTKEKKVSKSLINALDIDTRYLRSKDGTLVKKLSKSEIREHKLETLNIKNE